MSKSVIVTIIVLLSICGSSLYSQNFCVEIIEPKFDDAQAFSEGLAVAKINSLSSNKYGFIDLTGDFVIEPKFDEAESFANGLAKVRIAEKWGLKDRGQLS